MSTLTHIFGDHEDSMVARITCSDDEPAIWIRTRHETVSLTFDRAHRDALRSALNDADKLDPMTREQQAEQAGVRG